MRYFRPGWRTARPSPVHHRSIRSNETRFALAKLFIGLLATTLLWGCEESPEEARFKLSELGYEYNTAALFRTIVEKDPVGVALFMRAGMDPDEKLPYRGLMQLGHGAQDTPELLQMLQDSVQQSWPPEIQAWLNSFGERTLRRYHTTPLIVALVVGNTPTIDALLDAGADANRPDSESLPPLFWAVMNDRAEAVEAMIDHGARVEKENLGRIVLEAAVTRGIDNESTEILDVVLDAGGESVVRDNPVVPALTAAARAGHVDMMEMLLDAGAPADAKDGTGATALVGAVRSKSIEAVEVLLDADADPNLPSRGGVTPLIAAGSSGDVAVFEALLDADADPNTRSDSGQTVLIEAATDENSDMVRLLIGAGVDLDQRDKAGNTALHSTVASDRPSRTEMLDNRNRDDNATAPMGEPSPMAVLLLDAGADPDVANDKGETALFDAINNAHFANVQALLGRGANPNAQNRKGETPIMKAALAPKKSSSSDRWDQGFKERSRDILRLLVEVSEGSGGIDRKNEDGLTALMLAAREGEDDAVQALIDGGAGLDVRDAHGFTALIVLADKNRLEPSRAMLDAGADPNIQSDGGYTALMYAAARANLDLINALLAAGADATLQDAEGRTALNNVPRFRREVSGALRAAAQRPPAARTPEPAALAKAPPPPVEIDIPEPVADPEPPADPEPEAGPDARLANETYLGGMKKRGMKLYALSSDGNWCARNLVFKIQAESAAVFTDGTADFYMKRFGERINDEVFCPAAQVAEIVGYENGNGEPVFRGRSTADGGWAVN